ncbi:MAG: hypothetical protein ACOX4W_06380 [Bacilli bacterium]
MTEKEIKSIINNLEVDSFERELLNKKFELISSIIKNNLSPLFTLKDLELGENIVRKTNNSKDLTVEALIVFSFKDKDVKDLINLCLNEIENIIFLNKENQLFKNYTRDYINACASFSDDKVNYNLFIRFKESNLFNYEVELKKLNLFNEYQNKYSLFSNTIKFIRHYQKEENISVLTYELLEFLLMYGLKEYNTVNKYNDYLNSFIKALDDLLNNHTLSFTEEKTISKSFYAYSPITNENIASHINPINVKELRSFRKTLNFLIEANDEDEIINAPLLTIDVTPIYNEKTDSYSWSFEFQNYNIKNSGGAHKNNPIEIKTAILKGLFKALKLVTDSANIQTKNITIKGASNNILKCLEKNAEEYENNSRRKTITSLIEANNLKVNFI